MGFLKKIVKKVKKGVSKVFKGVKKIAKKISKSKVLKTIALVGAALVTGGATATAFGGQFASSAIGKALIGAKAKIMAALGPVQFLAKPFEFAGTMIGTGAGKVSDFLGFTTEAGRLGPDLATQLGSVGPTAGQINMEAGSFGNPVTSTQFNPATGKFEVVSSYQPGQINMGAVSGSGAGFAQPGVGAGAEAIKAAAKVPVTDLVGQLGEGTVASKVGTFAKGTVLGDVIRGTAVSVGTGAILQSLQPEPEEIGVVAGRVADEQGINLNPLGISRFVSEVDLSDMYQSLYFGTTDASYNMAGQNLYQQPTLGVMPS